MLPDLFYIICFTVSIFTSLISIFIGLMMILVVVFHRPCRTINNMMVCNTAAATILYSILQLISAGFGLQKNWLSTQPACVFRAYCYVAVCIAVCGSYAVQSISRLFFAVLYKHKNLLTWRIHWYLILGNYLMTILGPICPIFIGNGYQFEIESRLCLSTTKILYSSLLAVTTAYIIPLSIVTIVYSIIVYRARQSTRRVTTFRQQSNPETTIIISTTPNLRRELKLMKNILILVGILTCAGIPYLTLVFWHAIQTQAPPKPAYLLTMLTITIFFAIKMMTLFHMNNDIKTVAMEYCRKLLRC